MKWVNCPRIFASEGLREFFRLTAGEARRLVVLVAWHTGWSQAELTEMSCEDLVEWSQAVADFAVEYRTIKHK